MYRNETETASTDAGPLRARPRRSARGSESADRTPPVDLAHPRGPSLGAFLVGLQLTDSAFPSGFYTLSHGLEGFAQAGTVEQDTLAALLADLLRHGIGPGDATALALAHRAASAVDPAGVILVDERLYATKLGRGIRLAATRTGRQLIDLAAEVFDAPVITAYAAAVARRESPGTQAVAAGVVHAGAGVPIEQAVAADLFAFCASFAGAAVRLRLTDHRRAQVLLRGAAPVIEAVVHEALDRDLADLGGHTFAADVVSGRHERAEARMFAT
ncbi:urease accessory UreF family protein [Streptomyces sp. SID3343]|uniref:urease accessory protein UreF n=1 Tax=Streptomyces sp. SID3343 TaxID=2690260 RepID=UPI001369775C|nr:urease accessory UreF family protein [Streptomyces sp. SID3343]MYW03632.1 urease accessory protein [Streptomyces sp. SID3343]